MGVGESGVGESGVGESGVGESGVGESGVGELGIGRLRVGGLVVGALVAGALLATACGGGGRLDHHEYTQEVGGICRRANVELSRVKLRRLDGPEAADAVEDLVRIGRDALDELRSTKPPKADVAKVDEWLAALEQVLDEGDYASTLVRSGHPLAAFQGAARASILARRAHELARTFGVPDACRVPSLVHLG